MTEIPKKYTIDNAKNDIQNLQSQNLYDFQEIKRLDRLIKDFDKRILQAINLNNQINEKIQDDYQNLKKIALDENSQLLLNEKIEKIKSQISLILDKIKYLETNVNTINNNLNNHINSQHLSQTDVESIVNQLNGRIQTQISLILDRIKRLEDNSSSTPDEPDEPDTPGTPGTPDEPDEPDTPDTSGSYVTDENGNRLMAEDGSYLITD